MRFSVASASGMTWGCGLIRHAPSSGTVDSLLDIGRQLVRAQGSPTEMFLLIFQALLA